jgi:small subunit ribosomal protein S3
MGQKVNPTGFRLGNLFTWKSRWFATKASYATKVLEDFRLRKHLNTKLASAGLVDVGIERSISKLKIILTVGRPGVVIGKGGSSLEQLKKEIEKLVNAGKTQKNRPRI